MISRPWCGAALLLTLVLGPLPRAFADDLPAVVADHGGDVLWATAVVLGLGFLWPRRPIPHLAAGAYAISLAVELQQLWQPRWLVDFRARRLPGLVLGRGFLWADLVAYGLGVALGAVVLAAMSRRTIATSAPAVRPPRTQSTRERRG